MAETRTFKSAISLWIFIPIIVGVTSSILLQVLRENWIGLIIPTALIFAMFYLLSSTYYSIIDKQLRVKCGIFVDKKIEISSITKVVATKSLISAPALSLNRIEIFYNQFDSIIISPLKCTEFLESLKSENDKIEVKLGK